MPMFSQALANATIASDSTTGTSRGSAKNHATGQAPAVITATVSSPRSRLMVKPVSYSARLGTFSRISASSTPRPENASIACQKPVANATRPKSSGNSSRTSTSVLTMPSARVHMRQPISQAAPAAVRCRMEACSDFESCSVASVMGAIDTGSPGNAPRS